MSSLSCTRLLQVLPPSVDFMKKMLRSSRGFGGPVSLCSKATYRLPVFASIAASGVVRHGPQITPLVSMVMAVHVLPSSVDFDMNIRLPAPGWPIPGAVAGMGVGTHGCASGLAEAARQALAGPGGSGSAAWLTPGAV